ncbi:flagellar hook-basal body complex protein FliE [Anaerotignum neopropionicum]|uniref:Flagellar hook-basal body complex protein FliE n=1 Tax=Anaerotignum neopropionicum TaxID=36847 RepID=A0A136WIV0_9FIRM|nr:flagellar hook-basal body complex protein FliE [Anaerotignum neopropionicum]KXL54496.1 flagellar hook-basal body complex protein FliE [Anaerotignum neopropionicum]
MSITQINKLQPMQLLEHLNTKNSGTSSQYDFRNIFLEAASNVVETQNDVAKEQYLFATGQSEDTHSLGIAASKAQISVDLLVNLRNKALDSYNELMKMSL